MKIKIATSFPYLASTSVCRRGMAAFIAGLGLTALGQIRQPAVNFEGANPNAGLVLLGNTLYGTAAAAGGGGAGTVFSVNTDGTGFRILHSFTYLEGANPWSALIISSNTLYGTAYQGGTVGWGNGTVFAVNTDGTGFTNLHNFTAGSDGANPIGGLVLSSNTLYGTTRFGGSSGNGAAFSLPLPPLRPVIRCKHVTVSAAVGCSADASIDDGSYSPNAGDKIRLTQSPAGPYPLGDTFVTLTANGSYGTSNSAIAIVTVVDTTPPVITSPGDIVADATSAAGAEVNFAPTASDNCSLARLTASPASGSIFAIGTTTVNCEAADVSGNSSTSSFTIHVKGGAEQIHDLIVLVKSFRLQSGTANSLIVKLRSSSIALGRGDNRAARDSLDSFMNEVNAQSGKKLTADQADLLKNNATRIHALLAAADQGLESEMGHRAYGQKPT